MTKLMAVVALAFATSLSAQYDRNLHRVTPDVGPVAGGTTVTIEGDFNFSGLFDPCGPHFVWVGGRAQDLVSVDATKLVFRTRAYTPGRFDIKVDKCGATAVLKNAFSYGSEPMERHLLPVFLAHDVPAAHGSIWRTELGAYAEWPGSYTGDPFLTFMCTRPTPCPGEIGLEGPFEVPVTTDQHVPGRMLYEASNNPGHVTFNLRVRDVSREQEGLGTELPVVAEDDAFGPYEQFSLPNIPLGPLYRAKLRIYRLDVGEGGIVTLYTATGGPIPLTLSTEPLEGSFLLYPGYAEIDLDTLPQFASASRADILVGTPNEGIYWAFVAVTNNNTQQITTVTPR